MKNPKMKKRIQGSISVLLVLVMLPMMTLSALIVDMSRINMAKQMMSSAGDLAMNTALANYDTILKDVYGLFAMSQLEGMDNEALGTELNKYFAKTLSSYGIVSEQDADDYVKNLIGDFRDILNNGTAGTNFLNLENINLDAIKMGSLAETSILRKQIVEYMKYRAPLGVGMSFLDALTSFKKIDAQNTVVEAQVAAQESTQDVTKACQTLIDLIRAYDLRVEAINSSLKGESSSGDATTIPLEDYDSHPMKYKGSWGENYTHINKLLLVFCNENVPTTNGRYLKGLHYAGDTDNGSVIYITINGTLCTASGHGVPLKEYVPLAEGVDAAYTQVQNAISTFNSKYGYIKTAYKKPMLPTGILGKPSNNIAHYTILPEKENNAIEQFAAFEKFLTNQSDVLNYSQVQEILEQVAILNQYKLDFAEKIGDAINAKNDAITEKEAAIDKLNGWYDTLGNAEDMIDEIEWYREEAYDESWEDSVSDKGYAAVVHALGYQLDILDYEDYYEGYYYDYFANNLDSYNSGADKFIECFKILIGDNGFYKKTSENKDDADWCADVDIIKAAKKASTKSGEDFEADMLDDLIGDNEEIDESYYTDRPLYTLLSYLIYCHEYAQDFEDGIDDYEEAAAGVLNADYTVDELNDQIDTLDGQIDELEIKRDGLNLDVQRCLQQYSTFCANYQADLYYYGHYVQAAKNTVGAEAQKIQTHFSQLIANLKELRDDLEAIDKQIGVVQEAIKTYNTNLDNWEQANKDYGSEDSFQKQNTKDIAKARSEYDETLYDSLDTFVINLWDEFDEIYSKLTETTNFTYGTKRIDEIGSAEDLLTAVSNLSFESGHIVTAEDANAKLDTLYTDGTVEYCPHTLHYDYEKDPVKQLCFLSPTVLQLQALKYLNSTYPKSDKPLTSDQQTTKDNYEVTKDKLTGKDKDVAKTDKDASEKVDNDFGYTYEKDDKTANKGDLPSENANETLEEKEYEENKYQMSTSGEGEDERLDASGSLSNQGDTSGGILAGIADITTTAVENLYILNYIFENFSYSTIVQEQILKDLPPDAVSLLGKMTDASESFKKPENVANAKKKTTTLSNFPINEKNNYLYGAEIEYILFGKDNPEKNVTSARASIYALRFAFNCIFVFTDSGIRTSTMSAGLAVQAATLGIVPYQVVQIVLQLALAAAESAIDLSAMNHGLSVAVIKTRDTWSLGLSGAKDALKDAGDAAAQMAAGVVTDAVTKGINAVTTGINDVMEAGADKLGTAIEDMSVSLEESAKGVLESVADEILNAVMTEIEVGLNDLQLEETKEAAQAAADDLFQSVRDKLDTTIANACGDNEMAQGIGGYCKTYAGDLINEVEKKVDAVIASAKPDKENIAAVIAGEMNSIKQTLLGQAESFVSDIREKIAGKATDAIKSTKEKLQGYVDQCGENLTEEAANVIKSEISNLTNEFMDTTLKVNGTSTTTDIKSSPLAMFAFGYKDYLMILTYISICCGDSVLLRMADVIQMNMQFATGDFSHGANTEDGGKFLLSNAYTYVYVTGSADLDMFFMDLGLFADQVTDEEADPEAAGEDSEPAEDDAGFHLIYNGLLGY